MGQNLIYTAIIIQADGLEASFYFTGTRFGR